jgi:hypothetical protein
MEAPVVLCVACPTVDTPRPFVLAVPSRDAAAYGWVYPPPVGARIVRQGRKGLWGCLLESLLRIRTEPSFAAAHESESGPTQPGPIAAPDACAHLRQPLQCVYSLLRCSVRPLEPACFWLDEWFRPGRAFLQTREFACSAFRGAWHRSRDRRRRTCWHGRASQTSVLLPH